MKHIQSGRRFLNQKFLLATGILAFAVIGTFLLVNSHAATPAASYEAEVGTVGLPASVTSDSGASGGSAVKFSTAAAVAGFCDSFPALPSTKPTATNTGVPAGTALTASGSITVSTAGTVIDAKNITGGVVINANNVTIKNSKINVTGYYGVQLGNGVTGAKVLNSEIYTTGGGYIGVNSGNITVCGSYIHGFENGMTISGGSIIQANYIDKLASNQSGPHFDGIEVYGGGAPTKIWGNNIMMTNTSGAWLDETGAINLTAWAGNIDDVEMNGNWLGGGSYTLYVDEQGGYQATNVKITNNRWMRNTYAFGTHLIRDNSSVTTWSGNVFDDNGQAIAK